ncbi:MAG: uronate dehydrogenase, partial [Pseudonocardiales bacterium]|nr:uronate dehydrogenase [Pseudonocardiales bacterium]
SDDLSYSIVWGVSANTRCAWNVDSGYALGYRPMDDAETYAGALPAAEDDPTDGLVGGGFTSPGFGIDEVTSRS